MMGPSNTGDESKSGLLELGTYLLKSFKTCAADASSGSHL